MDVANPEGSGRKCACCGAPTPTHSMCACWDPWMALPEELHSDLLRSYSRDEFTNYHRALLKAVDVWRLRGVAQLAIDICSRIFCISRRDFREDLYCHECVSFLAKW